MPTYHRGRLVDHIHLRVTNLAASKRFYCAVLAALGREPTLDSFLLDPDGHNIEAVYHGPSTRNVASVEFKVGP